MRAELTAMCEATECCHRSDFTFTNLQNTISIAYGDSQTVQMRASVTL